MAAVGGIRDNWQLATGVTRPGATPRPTPIQGTVKDTAGRILGTRARDSLQLKTLATDMSIGGVSNVPFEALFASQQYRNGKLKANEYVAQAVANTLTFGAWTAGGALATAALAPLGLPAIAVGVIGFGAGMSAQGLIERLLGDRLRRNLADAIPAEQVKGLADGFTRYIANPLHDFIWKPVSSTVMQNKVAAAGVGGMLALRFPGAAAAIGKEVLTMGGGMALGMGVEAKVLDPMVGPRPDPFGLEEQAEVNPPTPSEAIEPGWAIAFQRVEQAMEGRGYAPNEARKKAREVFIDALVQDGANRQEAETLVARIAEVPQQKGAPHRVGQRLNILG